MAVNFLDGITVDGNVGIGTTAPTSNLHILGSASPSYQLDVSRDNDGSGGANVKLFHSTVSPSTSDAAGSIYFAESKTGAQATEVTYGRISVLPSSVTSNAEGGVMTFALADGVDASVDEAMRITQDGKVGIGTTSPSGKLHVSGGVLRVEGSGCGIQMPDTSGNPTLKLVTDQNNFTGCNIINGWGNSSNTGVGIGTTRSDGIAMQVRTGVGLSSGFATNSGTTRFIVYGDGGTKITKSLGVGANASTTTGRIDASNDVVAFSTSDIRLKDNIKSIDNALDKVNNIQGIEFDWIEKEEVHGNKGHDIGVIAQEIEKILPDVVTTRDSGYKAVKYEKIVPLLIEAIKDLSRQVDGLKRLI